MSWLAVHMLACDICGDQYVGKAGRARATVLAFARQTHGWHSNSHGVVIVCDGCIRESAPSAAQRQLGGALARSLVGAPSCVEVHAAKLRAFDVPNALALAELCAEAREARKAPN